MELLDTTATIETPERVRFRHRIAGPGRRAFAYCVDWLVAFGVLVVVVLVLSRLAVVPELGEASNGVLFLVLFLLQWGYGTITETVLGGRTPGKVAIGIRVVRDDGSPIRAGDALLRNLLRPADFLPFGFGLGVVVMATDPRFRRIGDMVAGTMVVNEDRAALLGRLELSPPVTEAERQELPPRVVLDRDEREAIEAFLRRAPTLGDARAEELARLLAPTLSERTGVTAPTATRTLLLAYARATGRDR